MLSFPWYQKLKPKKEIDCECEDENKSSFLQSKIFLGLITFFAIVMMTFPYYSNQLFTNKNLQINNVTNNYLQNIEFKIVGMTCDGCETFIEQTVSAVEGVYSVKANYENGTANISFDSTKTNAKEITYIIEETSYKVSGYAKTNRK